MEFETQGGGRYRERHRAGLWQGATPGRDCQRFDRRSIRAHLRCHFPIAGKDKLAAIIKESQAKGALDRRIYKVMRRSWANHYRRMLPSLLSALEFRSNNAVWRPVLAALDWIRSKVDDGCRYVPPHAVPVDEVIPAGRGSSVLDEEGPVHRTSYQLCVLAQLRDRIRSTAIGGVGAARNPHPQEKPHKDCE